MVVLSHRTWASRFGSDPTLIGRTIRLDDQPYTVIGVMPANSPFDRWYGDIWIPVSFDGERMNRANHWLITITGGALGLLKPGITIEQARTEMNAIAARLSSEYPETNKGWGVVFEPYANILVGPALRQSLYLLLGAVGLVLLIACVNVANVMLASGLARDREVGVRLALGAAPNRLIRQFLTASLLLSMAGGLLGIAVGHGSLVFLKGGLAVLPLNSSMLPVLIPAEAAIQLDWRVLSFAVGLSIACGVAVGLAPALGAMRAGRASSLGSGQRTSASVIHRRLRGALIVAQVALTFVLLTDAGLLLRSFLKMRQADPGFDGGHVVTATMSSSARRFATAAELHAFMREALARVRALPGVSDAAFVDTLPLQGAPRGTFVQRADRPILERAQRRAADSKVVGPSYFHVLGSSLRHGRFLSELDRGGAPLVTVINETMARTFFPDRDPVGERLLMDAPVVGMSHSGDSASFEIVGVIADEQLWPFSDRTRHAVVYVSNEQDPEGFGGIIVRTSLDPASFETTLRAVVAAVDKRLLVGQVKTVDQLKAESMNPDRVRSTLLGLFAAVALALSAIGIYGVIAYSVVLRTHEIGIRAALGASSVKLATLVAGQGLVLSLLGLLLGSLVALGVARFLQSLLFGVGTVDAITWSGAGVVVLAVAILAGIIPARAAARVDPLEALRAE